MGKRVWGRCSGIASAVLAAVSPSLNASTLTWDDSTHTELWATATNWNPDSVPATADDVLFPTVIPFSAAPAAILPNGAVAKSLTFNNEYSLSSGSLKLGAGGVIAVPNASSQFLEISSALIGTNGLTKTGLGVMRLSGANTFTGAVAINGGTLGINADTTLGNAANPVSLDSGSLIALATIGVTRSISIGAGGGDISAGNASTLTLNSALAAGGNALSTSSPGTVVVTTPSTRTGTTLVKIGVMRLTNGLALGSGAITVNPSPFIVSPVLELAGVTVSAPLNLASGSTLRGTGTAAYTGVITVVPLNSTTFDSGTSAANTLTIGDGANDLTGGSNTSHITIKGTAAGSAVVLAQPSDYVGGWTLTSGALAMGADNRLGNAANVVTFSGGILRTTAAITSSRSLLIGSSGGTIDSSGFDSSFGAVTGSATLTKKSAGVVTLASIRSTGGGLTIETSSVRLAMNGSSSAANKIASLKLGSAARLDLTNNSLVVTASLTGSWLGMSYTGITGLVASGYNGGGWTGTTGIITSLTDATVNNDYTSIAVASAQNVLGIGTTQTGTWAGQTVSGGSALVMYTYGGDANLDGVVDILDYGQIDGAINASLASAGWFNGDFNYDGVVDILDYGIIDGTINTQGAPLGSSDQSSLAAVPEPSCLWVGTISLMALRRSRRGSRCSGAVVTRSSHATSRGDPAFPSKPA